MDRKDIIMGGPPGAAVAAGGEVIRAVAGHISANTAERQVQSSGEQLMLDHPDPEIASANAARFADARVEAERIRSRRHVTLAAIAGVTVLSVVGGVGWFMNRQADRASNAIKQVTGTVNNGIKAGSQIVTGGEAAVANARPKPTLDVQYREVLDKVGFPLSTNMVEAQGESGIQINIQPHVLGWRLPGTTEKVTAHLTPNMTIVAAKNTVTYQLKHEGLDQSTGWYTEEDIQVSDLSVTECDLVCGTVAPTPDTANVGGDAADGFTQNFVDKVNDGMKTQFAQQAARQEFETSCGPILAQTLPEAFIELAQDADQKEIANLKMLGDTDGAQRLTEVSQKIVPVFVDTHRIVPIGPVVGNGMVTKTYTAAEAANIPLGFATAPTTSVLAGEFKAATKDVNISTDPGKTYTTCLISPDAAKTIAQAVNESNTATPPASAPASQEAFASTDPLASAGSQ